MKVLSLFDGLACGAIAFTKLGIPLDRYVAYEIDKYAVQAASHNFPYIEQRGDVFKADFTEYDGFDWVIGGSPCTYWSIAQKNNRETEASGLGWELFSQYVRAVKEAKPKYFLYENNKSMSKEIRASITETFGFEPILINSALVSAQNRQRLYWVGIRQADGTYRKADIEQPEDRGILPRDILDNAVAWREKSYCIDANYYKGGNLSSFTKQSGMRFMAAEPVNTTADGKAQTIRATCYKDGVRNLVGNNIDKKTCVAEPVCMRYERTDEAKRCRKAYEAGEIKHGFHELSEMHPREDGKTNTLSTVLKDNPICEPVRIGDLPNYKGKISGSQATRIYAIEGKSVNLVANGGGQGAKTGLYAVPIPSENTQLFATSVDGQWILSNSIATKVKMPVYIVSNGLITIKDKQYPIKLADGYYIIRKLTVSECKRLQTVPEWYDFSVISNSQAYKCLGNGWTVDVIVWLLSNALSERS